MLKILAICSKRNFIFGWVILKIIFLNQDSSSLLIVIDDLGGAGIDVWSDVEGGLELPCSIC